MDIKTLSPLNDNHKSTISTPPILAFESKNDNITIENSTEGQTTNDADILAEQFRLEREIADQSSIKTQDSFLTTYSTLHTILSQMQIKLAAAFLQETEYLQQREERLEQEEQLIVRRLEQLKHLQIEREQFEKEFSKLQKRLETAVDHVINFQTYGTEILRLLFVESRQIDEEISGLISQSLASLNRCRTMINEKIDNFSQQSDQLQSTLINQEDLIHNTQFSIKLMFELVNTLNQMNIEHSQEITMARTDFEKQHRQFIDTSETTQHDWNIQKQMSEVRSLENTKRQLEKELFEQTILLENIYTIIGRGILH